MSRAIKTELSDALSKNGVEFLPDADTASRSSFKIGGTVALALFPKSVDELIFSVRLLDSKGIKFEIFGNASNVLFAFEYYNGAFIFTSILFRSIGTSFFAKQEYLSRTYRI